MTSFLDITNQSFRFGSVVQLKTRAAVWVALLVLAPVVLAPVVVAPASLVGRQACAAPVVNPASKIATLRKRLAKAKAIHTAGSQALDASPVFRVRGEIQLGANTEGLCLYGTSVTYNQSANSALGYVNSPSLLVVFNHRPGHIVQQNYDDLCIYRGTFTVGLTTCAGFTPVNDDYYTVIEIVTKYEWAVLQQACDLDWVGCRTFWSLVLTAGARRGFANTVAIAAKVARRVIFVPRVGAPSLLGPSRVGFLWRKSNLSSTL